MPPMTARQIALELYARDHYDSREQALDAVRKDPIGHRRMLEFARQISTNHAA